LGYSDRHLFASVSGLYGSGLTNGQEPDATTYGRGLFTFNRSIHVDPNLIMNTSAGYLLEVGDILLRPEIYVENLFDHKYLLKGAFFSGASVGRPRTVELRLNAGF
jgi:hypothetical protein